MSVACANVEQAGQWLRAVLAPGANLSLDSRRLEPGDGFIAVPGASDDGRRHIQQAQARGASAIAYDPLGDVQPDCALPMLAVEALREQTGPLAADFYGAPSRQLRVIAVTGTNGKTSCTQWIAQGLALAGRRAAVVGTLGSSLIGEGEGETLTLLPAGLTTPDAVSMQRLLADLVNRGVEDVAVEASSIGLDQRRLAGSEIAIAAFTNLSRDHLDYHADMSAYAQAKRRLFAWPGLRAAVINGNDAAGEQMLRAFGDREQAIVYGLQPVMLASRAARRLELRAITETDAGMRMSVDGHWGQAELSINLLGRFNAINALAVAGVWLAAGMPADEAFARLAELRPIAGRMQRVAYGQGPLVLVDYAHTPDALEHALAALKPLARARNGRLVCLFGAGGDRDPGKRMMMARAAEQGADRVVLTSDNPRHEPPQAIIDDLRAGFQSCPWLIEPDRRQAILEAIASAQACDVILLAGKGHETYQDVAGVRLPFSDADIALSALREREAA